MDLTAENLCGLLIRSRLQPAETARGLFERWKKDAAGTEGSREAAQFARWLVAGRHLTEYQADLLCRGHADGFFLGPYKILERINQGRVAGVYRAVHEASGQVVAIKSLPPEQAKDPQALARFRHETRQVLQLDHAGGVSTFHASEAKGISYLVMELPGGQSAKPPQAPAGPSKPVPAEPELLSIDDAEPARSSKATVNAPAKAPSSGGVLEGIPVELPDKRPRTPPPLPQPQPDKAAQPAIGEKEPSPAIDVEPVSAMQLAMEFFRFRNRDLFMLLVGACAGGALVALVWMLVALASGGTAEVPAE